MNHPSFLSQTTPYREVVTCHTPDGLIRVIQNGPFLWVEADFTYQIPQMVTLLTVLDWSGWQPIPEDDLDQPELLDDASGVRIRFHFTAIS